MAIKQYKPKKFDGPVKEFNGRYKIDRLYKGVWPEYSREFLKNNPRCFSCGEKSEATDHIKVHLGDENIFWDRENHIPLCHRCHNFITNKYDRKIPQDLNGKLQYLAVQRSRNELSFGVRITPIPRMKTSGSL